MDYIFFFIKKQDKKNKNKVKTLLIISFLFCIIEGTKVGDSESFLKKFS